MMTQQIQLPKIRLNEIVFMGLISISCFGLSVFRAFYSDSKLFLFLNWNLFLSSVPWALSSLMILNPQIQKSKPAVVALLFAWLLFFPNAPYILTDLFHLRANSAMPIWFDLVLILSFAWTALVFGFMSLWDIEKILQQSVKEKWVSVTSVLLLFVSSFGIYLGRYLRWNSWDIITEPLGLLQEIAVRLLNPLEHPRTWGMTILMGFFLNLVYWSFSLIRKRA